MTDKVSIIIELNENLKIYKVDFQLQKVQLLEEIQTKEKILNLNEQFSEVWQNLYPNYFKIADSIYFFIGQRASFTNTRIIFLWLKGRLYFEQKKFFLKKDSAKLNLEYQPFEFVKARLESTTENDLVYSAEPKIGLSK